MAVDPSHRYSNEAEKDNQDILYDFKLKKHVYRSEVEHATSIKKGFPQSLYE